MPDFLGIGVQKSATTWLHYQLYKHPQIWLPPRKELHYFDRSLEYPSPSFLAMDRFEDRLNNNEFVKKMQKDLSKKNKSIEEKKWYRLYYQSDISDSWYDLLFDMANEKVSGEITPSYSILKYSDIQKIKKLYPNLKIILILRNPIKRAWSQLQFHISRGKLDNNIDIEQIRAFIYSQKQISRGDYISILNRWCSIFGKSMFIGFYDEISNSPVEFLDRVFDFLGVEQIASKLQDTDMVINSTNSENIEIPSIIYKELVTLYLPQIELLARYYEYPKIWYKNIADITH